MTTVIRRNGARNRYRRALIAGFGERVEAGTRRGHNVGSINLWEPSLVDDVISRVADFVQPSASDAPVPLGLPNEPATIPPQTSQQ